MQLPLAPPQRCHGLPIFALAKARGISVRDLAPPAWPDQQIVQEATPTCLARSSTWGLGSNGTENRLKHRLSAAARSSRCKHRTSWRGPLDTFSLVQLGFELPGRPNCTSRFLATLRARVGCTSVPARSSRPELGQSSCSVFAKILAKRLGFARYCCEREFPSLSDPIQCLSVS
jgi:hypothetical protein